MASALTNLGDCLRLPKRGDALALMDHGAIGGPKPYSAADLDALANGFAKALIEAGYSVGDRIGILGVNSAPFIIAYLGTMRAGAVAVPINHKLPHETVAHSFSDSGIKLAVSDAGREHLVPDGLPIWRLEDHEAFKQPLADFDVFQPGPDDLAEILYTSGSTGLPKGVPLPHAGQCWATAQNFEDDISVGDLQSTILAAPLYHMNGLFNLAVCLGNRTAIHSVPKFDAKQFLDIVADHGCTYLSGVPTMFALATRVEKKPELETRAQVQLVYLGSAPLSDALIGQVRSLFPNAEVRNGYGTTETGPWMFGPHPQGLVRPTRSIGYPVPEMDWRFANGSEQEGPFECRTPALTPGYLNRPEATQEKFEGGWYKTGDILSRDENGFFYFVGRVDDMFVCGGENIYPGEVEAILEKHPQVAQATVVPATHDTKGLAPVAFIVPVGAPSEDEIKTFFLENGPAYAHPRKVFFKEAMPLAGTNKIDRKALMEEAAG
ncbi:MAG: class I adenylate-forming enzyme family protein [Pseudomonadota bacterium]